MQYTMGDVLNNRYENHVLPFFWQKGVETKEVIVNYIQQMYDSDIKEFCVEARPFEGFCEEPWWERLKLIISEAKKRGMKFWILDDFHFPTGYANGRVKNYPGLNKKVLTYHMVNTVGPCKHFSVDIKKPYPTDKTAVFLGVVAVSQQTTLQLSGELIGDYFYFELPEGRWDLYVLSISEQTDVASDYINMVDKKSCEILIHEVYEKHYEQFSEEFGQTILGFFSDEPGFQNEKGVKSDSLIGKEMPLPWSLEVEENLIEQFGEQYLCFLPHLWREINSDTARVRKLYMDIVTNLYKENFSMALGNWCRSRDVKYIGHIIEDRESHARLGVGAGHFYRSMIGQDMAGSDIISNQLIPGLDEGMHSWARGVWDGEFFHYALGKMTSSLAYLDPKKHGNSMTEVFGAYGWHEGLKLMKWILDHFLVRGVNHFVPHAFSPASFPDEDCPPHFYAHGYNPQFRYFKKLMTYTNKMGTLFSNGRPKSSVALIYHAESEWTGKYMSVQKPAKILTQQQVEFDILPNDIFKKNNDYQIELKNELKFQNSEYSQLVIPYCEYMDDDLYEFICRTDSTKVIFLEDFPKGTYEQRVNFSHDSLSKHAEVLTLEEYRDFIEAADLSPIKISSKEPYLRSYQYQKNKENYFMLFNEHPYEEIDVNIEFLGIKRPYRVDLLNNQVTELQDGYLCLVAYESCLIVDGSADNIQLTPSKHENAKKMELSQNPYISFSSAKEYPIFHGKQQLHKLVDISRKLAPTFSGTIRYEFSFEMEESSEEAEIFLDEVFEVAEITLNGVNLGSRICPPYRFSECNLVKGTNSLVIDVTNTVDKEIYEKHSGAQVRQPVGILSPVIIYY